MNPLLKISCVVAALMAWTSAVVSADGWWAASARDAAWTNKPLTEIEEAARRGDASAQFYFARDRYVNAKRTEDRAESLQWMTRAAESGLADAQYMASRFYMSGTATTRDPVAGFKWAKRAADQGHPDGLAVLADAYASALGTTQNVALARDFFQRAIDAGSIIALDWFGHFYLDGEGRTVSRTNYAEALRCFERAASNGLAHAASHAINMNREGQGTSPNVGRAIFWARLFTDQHDMGSTEALASFYSQGLAEPRDAQDRPAVLIRRIAEGRARPLDQDDGASASLGSYLALNAYNHDLSTRYRYGIGTARDYIAAAQWMLVAYRQDVVRGRNKDVRQEQPLHPFEDAVRMTNALSGEEGHWQEAMRRIHRALEQSNPSVCREIGLAYRDGSALTPQDSILACVWLTRAVELNDTQAKSELVEVERGLTAEQLASAKKRFLPRSKRQP